MHIHFGIHRTGTTSIHSTLVNNLEKFEEQGVLYPELDVNHRHVRTAWQLISKKIDGQELVEKIKEEVTPDTKKIILSSEDFCQLKDSTWLQVLSKNFDLTASVYLRRQDLWLESWYNQHIKWPWDRRFSAATPQYFLSKKHEFYWLDYSWLLSQIEAFIDKEVPTIVDSRKPMYMVSAQDSQDSNRMAKKEFDTGEWVPASKIPVEVKNSFPGITF